MRDQGMGGTNPTVAALLAVALCKRPLLRHLVRHVEGDHSHQKWNEKQRRYQDEQSLSAKHKNPCASYGTMELGMAALFLTDQLPT